MSTQHPSIVTWHGDDEEQTDPFDLGWRGEGGTFPALLPPTNIWKGVPLTLYKYKLATEPEAKMVVGLLFGTSWFSYRRIKVFQPNPGAGDKSGGIRCRLPYYWDGVSPKTPARVTVQSIKNDFADATGDFVWRVYATDDKIQSRLGLSPVGTVTKLNTEHPDNRKIWDPVDCILDGAQYESFVPGWNEVHFKIGLAKRDDSNGQNNLMLPFANDTTTTNHYTFLITEVFTGMPEGVNFEFTKQENFVSKLGITVKQNGTFLDGDLDPDGGGVATRTVINPTNFASGAPLDLRTRSVWQVYSSNNDGSTPNDGRLDDYWWEAKMSTVFQINHESKLPIIVAPEASVGPTGNPLTDHNYFKYEPIRVNTPYPGGNNQWMAKNAAAQVMMTMPPPTHMNMAISSTAYWYMPYNIKALTYLKQGTPVHDTFDTV